MLEIGQIRERVRDALRGQDSFSNLANWLSRESVSLRFGDNEQLELADSVLNSLQVYFDQLIDEKSLRDQLGLLISDENRSLELRFVFDDIPSPSIKPEDLKSAINSQSYFDRAAFVWC